MSPGDGNDATVSAQRVAPREASAGAAPTGARSGATPQGVPRWLRVLGWVTGFFVEPFEVRSAHPAEVVGGRLLERTRTLFGYRRDELGLMQRAERPGGRFVVHERVTIMHAVVIAASFRILRDGGASRIVGVYRTAHATLLLAAMCAAIFVADVVVTVRAVVEGSQPGQYSVWFVYALFRALLQFQRWHLRDIRAFVNDLAE